MRSPNVFPVGANVTCGQPGGKPVAHRELIETIGGLLNGRDIRWEKVGLFASCFKCYWRPSWRVTKQSGVRRRVSLFRFVECGDPVRGPGQANGDLFRTVASVTCYQDVGNVGPRSGGSSRPPLFVKHGRESRDCFVSWFGVDGECARVLVSALGLEQDGGRPLFAEVGE